MFFDKIFVVTLSKTALREKKESKYEERRDTFLDK